MSKRWEVQAFLTMEHTGMDHDYPYGITYFRTHWGAERWARGLWRGFGPGVARVEVRRCEK